MTWGWRCLVLPVAAGYALRGGEPGARDCARTRVGAASAVVERPRLTFASSSLAEQPAGALGEAVGTLESTTVGELVLSTQQQQLQAPGGHAGSHHLGAHRKGASIEAPRSDRGAGEAPEKHVAVAKKKKAKMSPWRRVASKSKRIARATQRSTRIWACALSFALRVTLLRRKYVRDNKSAEAVEARRALASELREALLKLGPTFIKFGQLLSTRVDVLQPEVIAELVTLQNQVPGFAPKRAMAIVKAELGLASLDEVFATFNKEPLAAASLAQVHRATLKDGTEVIVKIQREGLIDALKVDCANIKFLATVADRLDPENEGVSSNWRGIAETSEQVLWEELDFEHERRACERFRRAFEEGAVDTSTKRLSKPLPYVKVPRDYPEFSTDKVLVLEYVPGTKISDLEALRKMEGIDLELVATRLTQSYLEQLCRHGFFHCDPHPGNVAVDTGYPGGRIVYYDFGMMEDIEPEVKRGFVDLVYAVYKNAPLLACDALEQMGVLRKGLDRFSIERIARSYLGTFARTVAQKNEKGLIGESDAKWETEMTPEEAFKARRARRAKLGADLFATQAERPFVFPPKFTFVFRALTTIDGIGKNLDPSYDLTRLSQPYLRELSDLRDGSRFKTILGEVGEALGWRPRDVSQLVTQPRSVASIGTSIQRIEDGELKLRVRALEAFVFWRSSLDVAFAPPFLQPVAAKALGFGALCFGFELAQSLLKLQKLDRNRRRFEKNEEDGPL